jgi:hypothetical protein
MFASLSAPSNHGAARAVALELRGEAAQPLLHPSIPEGWLDASSLESGGAHAERAADQLDAQMMLHRSALQAERTSGPAALQHAFLRHTRVALDRTADFATRHADAVRSVAYPLLVVGAVAGAVTGIVKLLIALDPDGPQPEGSPQNATASAAVTAGATAAGRLISRATSELTAASFSREARGP